MYAEPEAWSRLLDRLALSRGHVPAGADRRRRLARSSCSTRGPGCCRRPTTPRGCCRTPARCSTALGDRDVPRIHFGVGTGELLAADRRRGRGRRRRRLAGAAGRGRPPGRPGLLAAGQPRPGRPAGRPARPSTARCAGWSPQGRAARGHIFNLGPRRAARHRPRRADPRRRAGARAHGAMSRLVVVGAGITGLAAAFEWRAAASGRRDRRPRGRRPDRRQAAPGRAGRALVRHRSRGGARPRARGGAAGRGAGPGRPAGGPGDDPGVGRPARRSAPAAGRHGAGRPGVAPTGWTALLSPDGVARVRAEADAAAAAAGRRRRRRRRCCASGSATRWSTGWSSRCSAASTPGRADELSLRRDDAGAGRAAARRAGSVLAAAAAARATPARAAAATPTARCSPRSRDGIGVAARRAGRRRPAPTSGCARRRTGCAGRRPGFELSIGPAAAPELLTADVVLVTAPAPKAARLLADAVPGAVEPLQGIPYASMAVVAMAFPAQDVAAGSGLLVPPVTGRLVKGVTVSSAKWPHLAGDALLVRSSVGPVPGRGGAAADGRRPHRRGGRRRRRPAGPVAAGAGGDPAGALGRRAAAVPGRPPGAGRRRSGPRSARCPGWRSPVPRSRASACPPASATPTARSTRCSLSRGGGHRRGRASRRGVALLGTG